jgi:hypothetical protein
MVWRSEGLHSLDVVWAKCLFMENYQDKGTPIPSAAAVLHTLVLGSSSALLNMLTSQKLDHISAGIDFWTYVNRQFLHI